MKISGATTELGGRHEAIEGTTHPKRVGHRGLLWCSEVKPAHIEPPKTIS